MIEALKTPIANRIRLEIYHPDYKSPLITTVANDSEALRVVYFKNRDYMLKKIAGWLRQRMYSGDQVRSSEAAKLLVTLNYYENISFRKLCRVVHHHRSVIESIAPGEQSKFYNHYINTIVPILNDAAEMEGEVK